MEKSEVLKILKTVKKIVGAILIIIVAYAIIGNLAALNKTLYNVVRFRNYVVLTGSMEPSILPGDYITIFKVNKDNLKEGDIVTYVRDNITVTHKIVSIDGDNVITQGIANNIPDDPITKDDIVGKYFFKVPKVGYVMKFVSSLSGLILIFGLVGIAIFWEFTDPKKVKNNTKDKSEQILKESSESAISYSKEEALRDLIFDNLKELGRLSKSDEDFILNEKNIEVLEKWCKISSSADSIDSFFNKINV